MTFDREEVDAAFRRYWQLGAVGEDWDAWCDELVPHVLRIAEQTTGWGTAATEAESLFENTADYLCTKRHASARQRRA